MWGLARPESVEPVNFARESNDLQVWQRAMLDETLDELLDVFSTVVPRLAQQRGVLTELLCVNHAPQSLNSRLSISGKAFVMRSAVLARSVRIRTG